MDDQFDAFSVAVQQSFVPPGPPDLVYKVVDNVLELFSKVQKLSKPTDLNFTECSIRSLVLTREFSNCSSFIEDTHPLHMNMDLTKRQLEQCRLQLQYLENLGKSASEDESSLPNVSTLTSSSNTGVESSLGLDNSGLSEIDKFADLVKVHLNEFESRITSSVKQAVTDHVISGFNPSVTQANKASYPSLPQIIDIASRVSQCEETQVHLRACQINSDSLVAELSAKVDILSQSLDKFVSRMLCAKSRYPGVIPGACLYNHFTPCSSKQEIPSPKVKSSIHSSKDSDELPSYSSFEKFFCGAPSLDNLMPPSPPIDFTSNHSRQTSVGSANHFGNVATEKLAKYRRRLEDVGNRILSITGFDLSSIKNKSDILSLETYEVKRLSELKDVLAQIEVNIEELGIQDHSVDDYVDSVLSQIYKWETSVDDLRRKFYCHLNPEKSLLKSIELSLFSGGDDTTVYEFLSVFEAQSEHCCSPPEKAALLFSTYLSQEIQCEVESMKNNYQGMRSYLVRRFGDLRAIFDSRSRKIASLDHPKSPQGKISYFKKVYQLLLNCQAITSSDIVITSEVENILYSSTFVLNLSSHLPDDFIQRFSTKIERESLEQLPSGHRYFDLLVRTVESFWKELEGFQSIKAYRENPHSENPKLRTRTLVAGQQFNFSIPPTFTVATVSNSLSSKFTFPCFFHGETHELGNCRKFFSEKNKLRFQSCIKAHACLTCLRVDCLKQSRKCRTILPCVLVCTDCAREPSGGKRVPNVLVCSKSGHAKPSSSDLQTALFAYLKVLDLKLFDCIVYQTSGNHRSDDKIKSSFCLDRNSVALPGPALPPESCSADQLTVKDAEKRSQTLFTLDHPDDAIDLLYFEERDNCFCKLYINK